MWTWVVLLALLGAAAGMGILYLRPPAADVWEPAIAAFEAQDRQRPPALPIQRPDVQKHRCSLAWDCPGSAWALSACQN